MKSFSGLSDVSVIIPIGPKETAWHGLLSDLSLLPAESEIVIVATHEQSSELRPILERVGIRQNVRWLKARVGRAQQLNAGARLAERSFLWFLHADSRLDETVLAALDRSLCAAPNAFHYFDLRFIAGGPTLMKVNSVGVWLRSHWLRLPFGDQGFCLSRELFARLGGYCESAPFGEDHLLVWAAHRQRVRIRCTGAAVYTSARNYRERGWARTTAQTMVLTAKQALPEFAKLLRGRTGYESR